MRLDQLFPPERLAGMGEYMKSFASRFGIDDFQTRDRIPNTRRALALAEVARHQGKLDAYRIRAMEAHWRDGMDLERDEDLETIARESGLSADAVPLSVSDLRYMQHVDATRHEASSIGVEGIPTFVIDKTGLSGCQPYEAFEHFATAAGAQRRS